MQICIMEAIVFDLCDRMEWGGIWATTLVPVVIMLVVNYGVLRHKLKLSPLKFLRRDLSGRKQKRAIYLSPKMKIFSRFRLRVIFRI